MKCFKETIYFKYVDDELGVGERQKVSSHLKSCGHCQQVVDRLSEENKKIRQMFESDIQYPDLESAIMSKILPERESVHNH